MNPFHKVCLAFLLLLPATAWSKSPASVVPVIARSESSAYVVTATELNVRYGPGMKYSPTTKLHLGDTVIVVRMQDQDWAKILALAFKDDLSEMAIYIRAFVGIGSLV